MSQYEVHVATGDLFGAEGTTDLELAGEYNDGRLWRLQFCPDCARRVPDPVEAEVKAACRDRLALLTPGERSELERLLHMSDDELLDYYRRRADEGR